MRHAATAALALVFVATAAPRVARAGDAKDLLPLVGDDTRALIVVDVAHIRDSSAFQKVEKLAISSVDALSKLSAAGVDVSKLDTVLIAEGKTSSTPTEMIATGSFTSAEIDGYATSLGDKHAKHGGVTYWTGGNQDIALLGKRVVVTPEGGMTAVIDRLKKKSRSLPRSSKAAAIRAAIAMTDTRHDVWIAGDGELLGSEATAKGISIGLSIASDVVAQVRIEMNDKATATDTGTKVTAQIDQVKSFLQQAGLTGLASSVAVNVDDDVVEVGATLPAGEVDTLLTLVTRFL